MKTLVKTMCITSKIWSWNIQNVFEVSLLETDLSAVICYETHTKDRIASVPSSVFDTESLCDQ